MLGLEFESHPAELRLGEVLLDTCRPFFRAEVLLSLASGPLAGQPVATRP